MRVRRFQQDDAHIFCKLDQILSELNRFFQMLKVVYDTLGLTYRIALSTRPNYKLGDDVLWYQAENALETALKNIGNAWDVNPGDGAFYGPKIDITVSDAMMRIFQCATV